jgi:peptidoglycan/LPS O-acetylase OafA/YrhL
MEDDANRRLVTRRQDGHDALSVSLSYVPQLDSIRALAALMVIAYHLFPKDGLMRRLPFDQMGVNIFFVLSGYLISRILMHQRARAQDQNGSKRHVFRQFVIRRALRIFPIYYLYIFILLLTPALSGPEFRANVGFHLAYLSNFLFYAQQDFDSTVPHFWTLALEEQFYLFWPAMLLFVPVRRLKEVIVAVIVLGITGHVALIHLGDQIFGPRLINLLPPTVFYAFGIGGLLAWHELHRPAGMEVFGRLLKVLFVLQLPYFLYFHVWHRPDLGHAHRYIAESARLCVSIQTAYVIHLITTGKLASSMMSALNWPWLRYLGRISYGLYLYHLLVPMYYRELHLMAVIHDWRLPVARVLVFPDVLPAYLLAILAVAMFSWHVIELPVSKLKDKLQYIPVSSGSLRE